MRNFYNLWYLLCYPFFSIIHRVKAKGRENIPEGAAVICANHTSLKDPLTLAYSLSLKHFVRFMAKDEIMKTPVIGYLLKLAGIFGVKRGQADINAIKTALSILKNGGKLGIFPEGRNIDPTGIICLTFQTTQKCLISILMLTSQTLNRVFGNKFSD